MKPPTFRCTADEPDPAIAEKYGTSHTFDSKDGLSLDEFVMDEVIHLEAIDDHPLCFYLRVGEYIFDLTRHAGKWKVKLKESP